MFFKTRGRFSAISHLRGLRKVLSFKKTSFKKHR